MSKEEIIDGYTFKEKMYSRSEVEVLCLKVLSDYHNCKMMKMDYFEKWIKENL